MKKIALIMLLLATVSISCDPKEKKEPLAITLSFVFNGEKVNLYDHEYVTAAGDRIIIDEIKFFITGLEPKTKTISAKKSPPYKGEEVHYFDAQLPSTLTWETQEKFLLKKYQIISFILGIPEDKNQTGWFSNPPEVNMAWPETLGGGYHYLQINGKWNNAGVRTPFNIHTGRCAIRDENGQIAFKDMDTRVNVPLNKGCLFAPGSQEIHLVMDVARCFDGQQVFGFNQYGTAIMENMEAQSVIMSNATQSFSVDF